ncbi:type II secretion system protein N [Symbiopectobacterium purcellii]|uniref:type II secretion system protein N n=1 Tax=Symbiopectobacterium purcellii TaxID=2871826 RepID=UPI003F863A44
MVRFTWLMIFDKRPFFIISLVFFLIVLTCISVLILQTQPKNPSAFSGQEKRWPLVQDINYIAQMHIFGIKTTPAIKPRVNNEPSACDIAETDAFYFMVPRAKSEASVRALVISTEARFSVAVIDISGHQKLFSQGDNFNSSGEEVVRILSDRVIIRKNGHCAALMFVE